MILSAMPSGPDDLDRVSKGLLVGLIEILEKRLMSQEGQAVVVRLVSS